jgi:excisionase family DNA binding protein
MQSHKNEDAGTVFRRRLTCNFREAEAEFGISRCTLYAMARDGEIETVKLRGRRLIKLQKLIEKLGV